jgi:hypothetical protein
MNVFFCGITEIIPSLFREIFSERNSIPNPNHTLLAGWASPLAFGLFVDDSCFKLSKYFAYKAM